MIFYNFILNKKLKWDSIRVFILSLNHSLYTLLNREQGLITRSLGRDTKGFFMDAIILALVVCGDVYWYGPRGSSK